MRFMRSKRKDLDLGLESRRAGTQGRYRLFEADAACRTGHTLVIVVPGLGQDYTVTSILAKMLVDQGFDALAYDQTHRIAHTRNRQPYSEKAAQLQAISKLNEVRICPRCERRRQIVILAHSQGATILGAALEHLLEDSELIRPDRLRILLWSPEVPLPDHFTTWQRLLAQLKQIVQLLAAMRRGSGRRYVWSGIKMSVLHPRSIWRDFRDSTEAFMKRVLAAYEVVATRGVGCQVIENSGDSWFDRDQSMAFSQKLQAQLLLIPGHYHDWLLAAPQESASEVAHVIRPSKSTKPTD